MVSRFIYYPICVPGRQGRAICARLVLVICALLFTQLPVRGQVSVSVNLNRKSVYVQQPFHVTVTVYTRTWFTQPVEFGNLQVPNAFIVPFDKTQPGMFTIDGRQYPGIQFYYIVFPYKAGNFTIPSLEITAMSPPEGSSQARKLVLHTAPQPYVVKDVPDNLKEKGDWFVAKKVTLHDSWNPSGTQYKVGDVISRTLTINAAGTLPQFIPNLKSEEKLEWASTYPQDPVLTDTRSSGDANGRSTQTVTYLMEKAGDFTIPSVQLSYWNPYSARMETVATQSFKIHVSENPNLGILATLKDSLDATVTAQAAPPGAKPPFLILGMKWYVFGGWAALSLIVGYILFRILKKMVIVAHKHWVAYHHSEKYLYHKFLRTNKEPKHFLTALYRWWDALPHKPSASVGMSMELSGNQKGSELVKSYMEKAIHGNHSDDASTVKEMLKQYRKGIHRKIIGRKVLFK